MTKDRFIHTMLKRITPSGKSEKSVLQNYDENSGNPWEIFQKQCFAHCSKQRLSPDSRFWDEFFLVFECSTNFAIFLLSF